MKKILSLVLAVVMLATMAISTSAVIIPSAEGSGLMKTDSYDKITVSDFLDIYKIFGLDVPYGGPLQYKGETVYTWWYDDCPECDGFSFHYVSNGVINWKCLEPGCGKTGTIKVPGSDKEDSDISYSGVKCTECKSTKTLFVETVLNSGKLYDRYLCLNCKESFYTTATNVGGADFDISDAITCGDTGCIREASFVKFYISDGKLYARYQCGKGHTTDKRVYSSTIIDEDEYKVRVLCSRGGDYDISSGSYAAYGEKKTIEFYPNRGYVLTDVLVNGESVEFSNNKITITVKSNTVVSAYFEKATNLKSYTILAEASGSGKITAKKNGETVTSAKVSANYADRVTYKFVPASKNYVVSSVKVDGKSVGKSTSYTFSKLDKNHTLDVTFKWVNPFEDVKESYEKAVEYVTEAGIMSAASTSNKKVYFSGNTKVSVKTFAAALAEMADTADKLDTNAERIEWAEKYGLIDKDTNLTETCDVQTACALVRAYLEAIEDINDVSFDALNRKDSVKETAIAIDMVTATTYKNNRDLNRYDLAAVCYLVAGLEYED